MGETAVAEYSGHSLSLLKLTEIIKIHLSRWRLHCKIQIGSAVGRSSCVMHGQGSHSDCILQKDRLWDCPARIPRTMTSTYDCSPEASFRACPAKAQNFDRKRTLSFLKGSIFQRVGSKHTLILAAANQILRETPLMAGTVVRLLVSLAYSPKCQKFSSYAENQKANFVKRSQLGLLPSRSQRTSSRCFVLPRDQHLVVNLYVWYRLRWLGFSRHNSDYVAFEKLFETECCYSHTWSCQEYREAVRTCFVSAGNVLTASLQDC